MTVDQITEETIKILIDRFYHKIRNDAELGPVFAEGVGETDAEWEPHLKRMYDFWSSVMLASGKYQGNPMKKHKDLPPFKEGLFDRWLELFEQTVREVHSGEVVERYITVSNRIAESLKLGLYFRPTTSLI